MRVLFITSRFPGDLKRGDQLRAYQQLRYLSARHAITLLAFDEGTPDPKLRAELERCCEQVIALRASRIGMSLRALGALAGPLPLQVAMHDSSQLHTAIAELLQANSFDLAHVQMARMGQVLPQLTALPCVLDLIDALSLNMAQRVVFDRGPLRHLARLEAARLPEYERALCKKVHAAVVSANNDRAAIGHERLHTIGNGVDLDRFPYTQNRGGADIVFIGNLGYFPNVDAATWFASEVMPLLLAKVPHAMLNLVGARPAASLHRLAAGSSHVHLIGPVADVQPYLKQAAVAIAPMRAGSGQQIKILEAMASGTPVVATPNAAAGLDAMPGQHLLVAGDAQSFADAIARLLADPALAHTLAQNARTLIEQRYTWSHSAQALERLWIAAAEQSEPQLGHASDCA
ncbi:glycosyltransferase [Pseudolysobacter antarcticus]|uniref:Glycosyltransferase n=1 Tax=Pseudolysobacter antarcticus TaxID=2511995 RepID=A0A411HP69_9GAMM|nr:glycosyltransferase [Pseudolysobacter antarcticus]QBB72274.1 glycosyltransferase [Pseudolysobacter antarcticus]